MLIDRRRGDQNDVRVVSRDLWVSNDFLQVGLVLIQWNMLVIRSAWERSIIGAKEDGLSRSART